MPSDPGSFRDPSGSIFRKNGKIYRSIYKAGVRDFEAAQASGVYDQLIKSGILLPFQVIDTPEFAPDATIHCLSHPRLPMISYPWEWPFSLLKEAALIHLEAMEQLIPLGFWLRDASAFNVQYSGKRLCLIDTLSIGPKPPQSPWVAYGQFCSHFLAPLAMAAYCDVRTLSLWRSYMDGFPLDMAAKMLPFWRRYQPGLLMHLTLHARFQKTSDRKEDISKTKPIKRSAVSDQGLLGIIRSLKTTIKGIKWQPVSNIWDSYQDIRTYKYEDVTKKSEFVDRVVGKLKPKLVWDLGANTGEFSFIAAAKGSFVVSLEEDSACTESIYQRVSKNDTQSVLPLTMDLSNPSPNLGWNNSERASLQARGPADLLLALALIHHLVLSRYVPLKMVAKWFGQLSEYLIVEFVPPEDPMVKKLLINRYDDHHPYNLETFKSSFGDIFHFIDQTTLPNGRILFFCKRIQ
ncbi:MAG: SAM-dependent methyltransferase [Thermodesulfobacteriota bacterium]